MKYYCKYPNKSTLKGYFQKKFEEYKSSGRYSELLDNEIKELLGYALMEIDTTLCNSKEELLENMEILLKIDSMSRKECSAIAKDKEEAEYSIEALFLIMHDPVTAVDVIANNMKTKFRDDKKNQCGMFLKEAAVNCITEVIEANRLKPASKNVRFNEEDESKSNDDPENVRQNRTAQRFK